MSKKKKILIIVAGFIGLMLIVGNGSKKSDSTAKTNNPAPIAQEAVTPTENIPKPPSQGYLLAKRYAESKGQSEPDQYLVVAFEQTLRRLHERCTADSELRIAAIIIDAQKQLLVKQNIAMELPEVADGIRTAVYESSTPVDCFKVANAFVASVKRNDVKSEKT